MTAPRCFPALISLALAVGATARAQQPTPSPSPAPPVRVPVFPGGVEQVVVDVVVADGQGQAFTGLTQADFTLTEDGSAREILSFESVAPEDPAAPAAGRRDQARLMRAFALVFDDVHLTAAAGDRAKEALRSLLTEVLRESDEVALMRTSTGETWSGRVGADRAQLLSALAMMRGRAAERRSCDMSDEEAMQIAANRDFEALNVVHSRYMKCGLIQRDPVRFIDPTPPPPEGPGAPRRPTADKAGAALINTLATDQYQQSLRGIRSTYAALEKLLRALTPLRGRKSVILASEGFVRDRGMVEVEGVVTAASDANAAVYFLDARTITARVLTARADGPAMPDRLELGRLQQGRFLGSEATELLAEDTGGAIVRGHDLGQGLRRLADESRSYYLLGYSPRDRAPDGKFRAIKVEVKRPGLTVRARRGYYASRRAGPPPANVAVTAPAASSAPPARPGAAPAYGGDSATLRARVAGWSPDEADQAVAALKASNAADDVVEAAALAHGAAALAAAGPAEHQARAARAAAALVRDASARAALERRILLGLAHWFLDTRRWQVAQDLAQEATQRPGDDADALLALGIVQETTGSVVDAGRRPHADQSLLTAGFDEMLSRNPVTGFAAGVPGGPSGRAPDTQRRMSQSGATAETRLRRAAETYRRALKARPDLAEARLRLGRTLALLDEAKDAAPELQAVAGGGDADLGYLARLFLGDLKEQQGDLVGAAGEYQAALAAREDSAVARLALARVQQARGDRPAAQAALQSLLLETRDDPQGDPWWRYRLRPLGRWADALAEAP